MQIVTLDWVARSTEVKFARHSHKTTMRSAKKWLRRYPLAVLAQKCTQADKSVWLNQVTFAYKGIAGEVCTWDHPSSVMRKQSQLDVGLAENYQVGSFRYF